MEIRQIPGDAGGQIWFCCHAGLDGVAASTEEEFLLALRRVAALHRVQALYQEGSWEDGVPGEHAGTALVCLIDLDDPNRDLLFERSWIRADGGWTWIGVA